jgi:NADH:ubiquinone oxidoreductase subunit 6 (subunit J)
MLSQITLWTERAGMLFDLVLLVRILALKLRRTYTFITLYALMGIFYDALALLMGIDSPEFRGIGILSKLIYAIVFPLASWDLFEEAKLTVDKVRKMAMSRMLTSLLLISLWGLLIAAFTGTDEGPQSQYLMRVSLIVWTGAIAASIAFLWVMRKGIKLNHWELPWNTVVWYRFFGLILLAEAASCALGLTLQFIHTSSPALAEQIAEIGDVVIDGFGILITAWCVYKLRAVPSDAKVENAPA